MATVALAVSGCGPFRGRYEPQVPMRARTGDVDLRLIQVLAGGDRDFVFTTVAARPHALRQAWMTVAARAPCSGGQEVTQLLVDDGQVGVLPVGEHELRATVPARVRDFELDAVIDVEIDDGACVRVPVVSQSIPLVGQRRLMLVFTSAGDVNDRLSGHYSAIAARVGAGGWLGPVLVTGEVGAASAYCEKDVCGTTDSGARRSRAAISGAAAAHVAVLSGTFLGMYSNVLLGARYTYTPVTLSAAGSDRRFDVHGIQAVIGWGSGASGTGPLRRQERGPTLEINLPIGMVYAPGAPDERRAFSIGLEFRFLLPI